MIKQDGMGRYPAYLLFCMGEMTIAIRITPFIGHLFSHLILIISRFYKCFLKMKTVEAQKE